MHNFVRDVGQLVYKIQTRGIVWLVYAIKYKQMESCSVYTSVLLETRMELFW